MVIKYVKHRKRDKNIIKIQVVGGRAASCLQCGCSLFIKTNDSKLGRDY